MVIYGWLSKQDQTLAHLRDHFTLTITCNWTPLESELLTSYVASSSWLLYFGPIQKPPLGFFPHVKANKFDLHGTLTLKIESVTH